VSASGDGRGVVWRVWPHWNRTGETLLGSRCGPKKDTSWDNIIGVAGTCCQNTSKLRMGDLIIIHPYPTHLLQ
jgi:hypothetical protein